jgi:sensor histidine kinase YesM
MSSYVADSIYKTTLATSVKAVSSQSAPNSGIRLNAHAVVFSLVTVLALATASECHSITYPPSLLYGAVLWEWWGVIASTLWMLSRRAPNALGFSLGAIVSHVVIGSVLGTVHLLLLGSLGFTETGWQTHHKASSILMSFFGINRFGMELLIYGFIFGVTGIVRFQIQAQREAMKSLELEKQLSAAQLRALQMQLEPHFLFNTLNAITTLVELGRSSDARRMLFHLNSILKSTLKRTVPEKIPLSQELDVVESYLAIEQVRFADRLHIEIKVEPGALDGLVPCFLLQPIVENAIRHGIANCEGSGIVEASARRDGSILRMKVRDSGSERAKCAENGHGIGLKNTRDRLAHFYRDDFAMHAEPLKSGGFEVSIAIPYERS